MMRLLLLVLAVLPLSGCVEMLGAKPLDFDCSRDELSGFIHPYEPPVQFGEIQRDVGDDLKPWPRADTKSHYQAEMLERASRRSIENDPIYLALTARKRQTTESLVEGENQSLLLLSGGGQWGAFGAGFLDRIRTRKNLHPQRYDVITGVSTGAIQALFAATDSWEALRNEYVSPSLPAKHKSFFTAAFSGYQNDTAPLRERLEEVLCPKQDADACTGLASLGTPEKPQVFIGMIESRTGDFKVIDVTALAKAAISANRTRPGSLRRAARCLAGVTMASAAVPVQLRPVRLTDNGGDPRTYADGGVRLSVFEANLATIAEKASKLGPVDIYVVRNGPTVVMPNGGDSRPKPSPVDLKPTIYEIGMMSYSTLVNQNEVMSIATLRLLHPTGSIRVATADGYATDQTWPDGNKRATPLCHRDKPDHAFEHQFMACLADWGEEKAGKHKEPWIELAEIPPAVPAIPVKKAQ